MMSACARIVPTESSAQRNVSHFLTHYGKTYPESRVGKGKVKSVEVYEITHLQRRYANVTVFLTLESGEITQAAFTLKKEPFGWKVDSWELLR